MYFSWQVLLFIIIITTSVLIIHSSYGDTNNVNQISASTDTKMTCSQSTLSAMKGYEALAGTFIVLDNSTLTKYPDLQEALIGVDRNLQQQNHAHNEIPTLPTAALAPFYDKTISGDITAAMLKDPTLGFTHPYTCGDKLCNYTELKRGDTIYLVHIFFADCTSKINYILPRQQIAIGVTPENVVCSNGLVLIKRPYANYSACVRPQTAQKLAGRGWETIVPSPGQIVSVKTIPTNPKVGDNIRINFKVQNKANYPIYYGFSTCAYPRFSVSITPADSIKTSPSIPCACAVQPPVQQISPNDTINAVYPQDCFGGTWTILKPGVIVVKSTFLWGTSSQNPETNVTSILSTFNIPAKENNGTLPGNGYLSPLNDSGNSHSQKTDKDGVITVTNESTCIPSKDITTNTVTDKTAFDVVSIGFPSTGSAGVTGEVRLSSSTDRNIIPFPRGTLSGHYNLAKNSTIVNCGIEYCKGENCSPDKELRTTNLSVFVNDTKGFCPVCNHKAGPCPMIACFGPHTSTHTSISAQSPSMEPGVPYVYKFHVVDSLGKYEEWFYGLEYKPQ